MAVHLIRLVIDAYTGFKQLVIIFFKKSLVKIFDTPSVYLDIEIQSLPKPVSSGKNLRKRSDRVSVPMARGKHLFPFRTQKLSLVAVTILHLCGKIARCRVIEQSLLIREAFSFWLVKILCFIS